MRNVLTTITIILVLVSLMPSIGIFPSQIAVAEKCPHPATFEIHTTDVQNANPVWKTSYDITTTDAIQITVDELGHPAGKHMAQILIYSPDGTLYSSSSMDLSRKTTDNTACGVRAWKSLPIAGTDISQLNLIGDWTVSLLIDGTPTETTSFRLVGISYGLHTTDVRSPDPVWKTSYDLYATSSIFIADDVYGSNVGTHDHQLFLYGPGGVLMRNWVYTVSPTSGEPIAGGIRTWITLPVEGSEITEYNLLGDYRLVLYKDYSTIPIASTTFTITSTS